MSDEGTSDVHTAATGAQATEGGVIVDVPTLEVCTDAQPVLASLMSGEKQVFVPTSVV